MASHPHPNSFDAKQSLAVGDHSVEYYSLAASGLDATFSLKSDSSKKFKVQFVRIEPYVIPKVSLTGASTERVDTRVLQVIYKLDRPKDQPLYVGQQVDVFIARKK